MGSGECCDTDDGPLHIIKLCFFFSLLGLYIIKKKKKTVLFKLIDV